jgi:aminoglycoside phosphotransferase (APT) family kinase protein
MQSVPERVKRVVETGLDCAVRSCERPAEGRVAETYLLEVEGSPERVVCKLGGPSIRTGDVIEPLVLELVGTTTDLPVPAVLASGWLPEEGTHWALYEFSAGSCPVAYRALSPPARRRTVTEVGAALAQLHAAHRFERTGGLARDGDRLAIRDSAGLDVPEWGRRLAERHTDWTAGEAVLTHGDLFPSNLVVERDGRVTGIFDWGNAHVTTAGYALARAEMRFVNWYWHCFPAAERRDLRAALRAGYRQHRPLPSGYRPAPFHKLLWLAQSGQRHLRNAATPRGRRQLRRHLRSLLPGR